MLDRRLRHAGRVRRYSVSPTDSSGWEVKLEEDRMLRRHDLYQDWHRVERAMLRIELEVSELTARGWQIETPILDTPGGPSR
jgi:hypothetical protein